MPGTFTPREHYSTSLHCHSATAFPTFSGTYTRSLPPQATRRLPTRRPPTATQHKTSRSRRRPPASIKYFGRRLALAPRRPLPRFACWQQVAATMAVSGTCPSSAPAGREVDGGGRRQGDLLGRAFACTLGVSLPCHRCAQSGPMRQAAPATPSTAARQPERQIHDTHAAGTEYSYSNATWFRVFGRRMIAMSSMLAITILLRGISSVDLRRFLKLRIIMLFHSVCRSYHDRVRY